MSAFVLGVIADLRRQRMLPIAIVLVAALVAVPVLLRKGPEPVPPVASAPAVETTPDGLPAPDAALASDPLVTMASLEGSSDLDSFDARDPFKPLKTLAQVATVPALGGGATDVAGAGSDLGGATADLASPAGSGDTSGGSDGTGGGLAPSPEPSPGPSPSPAPSPAPPPQRQQPSPDPQRLTYAIDVSFTGPDGRRTVRGLPRLSMLPNESAPLLVFLGVSDNGNEAVFLVDSKLTAETGEGDCVPSPEQCATLELAPGELQTFIDAEGRRYVVQLDQIREVDVERAAQARERLAARAAASSRPVAPFLPVLVDVLTMGQE